MMASGIGGGEECTGSSGIGVDRVFTIVVADVGKDFDGSDTKIVILSKAVGFLPCAAAASSLRDELVFLSALRSNVSDKIFGTVISSFPGSSLLTLRISNWIAITATSDLQNSIRRDKFLEPFEVFNGSGWKWTKGRDLDQLTQCRKELVDGTEVIWILWLDHWPVIDYAKISEYLVLGGEVRQNSNASQKKESSDSLQDWMIHCKKVEQRLSINQICSSKEEIMERVSRIYTPSIHQPMAVYLAEADILLEDDSIPCGWKDGFVPFEKKRLGIKDMFFRLLNGVHKFAHRRNWVSIICIPHHRTTR
ncbi:hypothetical protein ZIOFF_040839 [Zingiber officinale]|uniref:Uncharacterized protein n=1 Tax=Zingiber officinale TaxID=94328 RepID=A0A8J5G6S3_ZINOF|nr:hypothetical protein ZIOFF_040839 [Zingiber officinale]